MYTSPHPPLPSTQFFSYFLVAFQFFSFLISISLKLLPLLLRIFLHINEVLELFAFGAGC